MGVFMWAWVAGCECYTCGFPHVPGCICARACVYVGVGVGGWVGVCTRVLAILIKSGSFGSVGDMPTFLRMWSTCSMILQLTPTPLPS